ncbi:MAG: hypothetical protein IJW00_05700 [Clostridia bacterium]|nr:hypothetical protein [Clostridia bacterium]
MAEMKSLNGHEIVDAAARERLDDLENNGAGSGIDLSGYSTTEEMNTAIANAIADADDVVIVTADAASGLASHTSDEILEFVNSDRSVVLHAELEGTKIILPYVIGPIEGMAFFASLVTMGNGIGAACALVDSTGKVIASVESMGGAAVRYDQAQNLTDAEKAQARQNMGITGTGADGKTPVKGVDYYTEDDKAEVVQEVLATMDLPLYGYVDENKNIIISGTLEGSAYTVKYEMEDGSTLDIGDLVLGTEQEITNQIPLSTDTDGTIYNGGLGYKTDTRINSSGVDAESADVSVTGYIPAENGQTVYMKGIAIENSGLSKIVMYDSDKSKLTEVYTSELSSVGNDVYSYTIAQEGTAYIRISSYNVFDGSQIVTIDQPIE